MNNFQYATGLGAPAWLGVVGPLLFIVVIWSILWKGLALWHSARRGQPWWFVILLIVNTAGILEIIYLFAVARLAFGQLFSTEGHRNTSTTI